MRKKYYDNLETTIYEGENNDSQTVGLFRVSEPVFASFTIWKIAVNIGNEMSPTLENTSYTITKNGNSTTIKCNSCNKYCHYNTAPEQCPHCGNYFTDGYTTKTQIDNYTYRCDYCNNTYNPLNWRNNNCPSCGKNFK